MSPRPDMLARITRIIHGQRQQAFAELAAEELRLRRELARLDDMRRLPTGLDDDSIPMRAIGADVLWQGWIGRAKTALNLQLAQILSRKESELAQVRRAHGKMQVAGRLRDDARQLQRHDRDAAAMSQAIEIALMQKKGEGQ